MRSSLHSAVLRLKCLKADIFQDCNLETLKLLNFSALDGIKETLVADTALGVSSDLRH